MTVDLDSGTGLFDRLGKTFYVMELVEAFLAGSTADDLPPELNDVIEEFDAETDNTIRGVISNLITAQGTFQSAGSSFHADLITMCENLLIEMVDADNPLSSKTVANALAELIRQMETGSETVDGNEPTASSTAGSGNDGDGVAVISVLDGRGETMENVVAEDLFCEVTSADTQGSEVWSVGGERNLATQNSSIFWPSGSGSSKSITVINPATNNILTNGAFESFTTNAPDNWTIDTGTAGTTLDDETTNFYRGAAALKYIGNGAELTTISQDITSNVSPHTPYVVSLWTRVDASAPAAGALVIDLYDGTSVIADEQSANNSLSIDLTSETGTYANHNAVFRLPSPLPASVLLRVRLSTALTSAKNAFIDDLALVAMTQMYAGGPYVALVTGDSYFSLDDTYTFTVTNDYRGKFQSRFRQVFNQADQQLPSNTAGSETIPDTLIA